MLSDVPAIVSLFSVSCSCQTVLCKAGPLDCCLLLFDANIISVDKMNHSVSHEAFFMRANYNKKNIRTIESIELGKYLAVAL